MREKTKRQDAASTGVRASVSLAGTASVLQTRSYSFSLFEFSCCKFKMPSFRLKPINLVPFIRGTFYHPWGLLFPNSGEIHPDFPHSPKAAADKLGNFFWMGFSKGWNPFLSSMWKTSAKNSGCRNFSVFVHFSILLSCSKTPQLFTVCSVNNKNSM